MADSLATVRTDTRAHLDEPTAARWTDTDLTRWINEAAVDIARRAEVLEDFSVIPVTLTGNQNYLLPPNCLRVHRVEFQPTGTSTVYPLELRRLYELDEVWGTRQTQGGSVPLWAAMWGVPGQTLSLKIFPVPSQTGQLNAYYYRSPFKVTNATDVVDVPGGWDGLIPLYCEYMALRQDADPRWQEAKTIYEERLAYMMDLTRSHHDQSGWVTSGVNFVPWWLSGSEGY